MEVWTILTLGQEAVQWIQAFTDYDLATLLKSVEHTIRIMFLDETQHSDGVGHSEHCGLIMSISDSALRKLASNLAITAECKFTSEGSLSSLHIVLGIILISHGL